MTSPALHRVTSSAQHESPATLSTRELSRRWQGSPDPKWLRAWRACGIGPRYEIRTVPGGRLRRAAYPIQAVQAYELARSSIPRKKPWAGIFLTSDQLLERWEGSENEATQETLFFWRRRRGRLLGPSFVVIHRRWPLYPLEAIEIFESLRGSQRVERARRRARLEEDLDVGRPTFGELLIRGMPA